ncbi:hypothetical protein [Actinocorallia populi]|uniref:hypothetical protein n=1 Tax=Actinocorallia populi TaxID=2079200 RepID=UPI000D086845|nr:hypothetical protein [Actinocorallia populi]
MTAAMRLFPAARHGRMMELVTAVASAVGMPRCTPGHGSKYDHAAFKRLDAPDGHADLDPADERWALADLTPRGCALESENRDITDKIKFEYRL